MAQENLFSMAERCLLAADPDEKVSLSKQTACAWRAGRLTLVPVWPAQAVSEPGRPEQPHLVHPRELPRRSLHTESGQIVLIHALTHIEFNAVNLAWDAVYRFRGLPREYYADWLKVAAEEAYHFTLLRTRLREFGYDYGAFPAHDGLWDMARRTAHDVLVRMALVPRVLEARGLDVTPGMIKKLRKAKDHKTASILEIILRDELGHVAIGSHWFKAFCQARGADPEAMFRTLLDRYFRGRLRGPFDYQNRLQAGFSQAELDALATSESRDNTL